MQSILIFVLSTSKILNLPFEHCIKSCKKTLRSRKAPFLYSQVYANAQKVNRKFTNWHPVLIVKKMMLTKSEMRFS